MSPRLHVLMRKEELDAARLRDKVVLVIDVLFASSTIVAALDRGVASIWPARDAREARAIASATPGSDLAGEYLAGSLPGFGPATPLALAAAGTGKAGLVYCTTNGTVALAAAAGAAEVYVAALSNGAAVAAHVVAAHPGRTVLVVCAGSVGRFNLEDFYCAGHLVAHLRRLAPFDASDAALAAALAYGGCTPQDALSSSRVGRMMAARGLAHEVAHAGRRDTSDAVPVLRDGRLERARPAMSSCPAP